MTVLELASADRRSVLALFRSVTADLRKRDIRQWDFFYPNRFVIGRDLKKRNMYGVKGEGRTEGVVVLDAQDNPKYAALEWEDRQGRPACIHRLAVHPACQGRGLGKGLLQFAEELARERGHTSIRLDVYAGNPGAVALYRRSGYRNAGEVRYPMRPLPYLCMEKLL